MLKGGSDIWLLTIFKILTGTLYGSEDLPTFALPIKVQISYEAKGVKYIGHKLFQAASNTDLIIEGPGQCQIYQGNSSVFSGCPSFRVLALRLKFRQDTTRLLAPVVIRREVKGCEVIANAFLAMEGFVIRIIVNVIWARINAI